jgi:hypothetical protein
VWPRRLGVGGADRRGPGAAGFLPQLPTGLSDNAAAASAVPGGGVVGNALCLTQFPAMARPRFTAQITFRLAPALRDDLEREAQAKGDDLGELVRDILADHTARRFAERTRQESRR